MIAASTGNHGQSVAYAARLFGVSAIICAPAAANPVKVESMQDLGAEVILEGERYDDSRRNAERLANEHGYRYIHSGDEPLLISGVGTHTLEVLREQPDVDTILVPIGGGSGAAGAATAVMIEKTRTLVEAAGACAMAGALKLRDRLRGHTVALICSGGNISPAQLKALLA